MKYRPVPLPNESRATRTYDLMKTLGTDVERWSQTESLATQWDSRAAMAARFIAPGSSVLDLGCGAMTLGQYLDSTCQYYPADVVERIPGAFVVDLNAKQFPPGSYDVITLLGVLEYVHDVPWVLDQVRKVSRSLIVTYCAKLAEGDVVGRRGLGWVNDFTERDFNVLLASANWRCTSVNEVKRGPGNIQIMFCCS